MGRKCAIVTLGISLAIGLNIVIILSRLPELSPAYQEAAEILYSPSFAMQLLLAGLVAPILEELIFRSLVYRLIRKFMPFFWAALISALIFGIYHGNLVQFVYATVCGMFLAFVYEKEKSVIWSMLLHMVMNVTACVLTETDAFTWIFSAAFRVFGLLVVCVLIGWFSVKKIAGRNIT